MAARLCIVGLHGPIRPLFRLRSLGMCSDALTNVTPIAGGYQVPCLRRIFLELTDEMQHVVKCVHVRATQSPGLYKSHVFVNAVFMYSKLPKDKVRACIPSLMRPPQTPPCSNTTQSLKVPTTIGAVGVCRASDGLSPAGIFDEKVMEGASTRVTGRSVIVTVLRARYKRRKST